MVLYNRSGGTASRNGKRNTQSRAPAQAGTERKGNSMKSVIEHKCGHGIDWKEVFRLATDIIRYNHGGAVVANGNTANNLVYRAAQMGVTVKKYEHSVEIMARYGEPETLSHAYDILTASKKRNPTPRSIRAERKADEKKAEWYNIDRYYGWMKSTETEISAEARNIRYLRKDETAKRIENTVYAAQLIADYNQERKNELQARLNYPEQITRNLCGEPCENRYQQELPF